MGTEGKAQGSNPRPRKRRRSNEGTNKTSTSKLKKKVDPFQILLMQIRDVQRLLNRENLKANVREDHERELSSLKKQLEMAEKQNKEHIMAKKYQMVRFFGILFVEKSSNSQNDRKQREGCDKLEKLLNKIIPRRIRKLFTSTPSICTTRCIFP
jgi:hypothetical protein